VRQFRDKTGKSWEAFEVGRHGAGAKGSGEAFPQATFASVLFSCEDGRSITRELAAGSLDKATVPDLISVLDDPEDKEDE